MCRPDVEAGAEDCRPLLATGVALPAIESLLLCEAEARVLSRPSRCRAAVSSASSCSWSLRGWLPVTVQLQALCLHLQHHVLWSHNQIVRTCTAVMCVNRAAKCCCHHILMMMLLHDKTACPMPAQAACEQAAQ